MKAAFILLSVIFVAISGISARSVSTPSNQASRYPHVIKQLVEQKNVSKLCAIRQELEQKSNGPDISNLKLLDDLAALELGFSPHDCAKATDVEAFEVTKVAAENLVGRKDLELGAFVENDDQDMSKDQASVQALLNSDNGEDPLKPLADLIDGLESSRVSEEADETGKDIDFTTFDSSPRLSEFECNNCSGESYQMPDFTSTYKDSEQTSSELYKVIGIAIGVGALAIVILVAIICLICHCQSCCNSKRENNVEYYRQNPNAF